MRRKIFTLVLMVTLLLFSTTALAFNTALPIDGIYSLQPKCAPDKELSVENQATNWGANVIIDNINSNWRKWKIQRIPGTDFYSIIAIHSNLSLDVANAQATNGVNIATWPYLSGIQNQFRFWDAGNGYYIIQANIGGNFVLDVVNAENRAGANVWSYGFNNSDAQLWRLVMIQRLSTFQPYDKVATKTVPAYVMPDLTARSGNEQVDKGDKVTVLREEGNAIFVRYPIRGGTKERWVNKNEIFGGSNKADFQLDRNSYSVSSPANYQLRFTGRIWNANNSSELTGIHVYIGGGAGAGGQFLGEFKSDNNHNFNATLNVPQNRSGNQLVVIYAVNGVESKELDRRNVNIQPSSSQSGSDNDYSRTSIQKRLMQAVFHTTQGTRISTGGDFDGYIELKKKHGWIHEGIDLVWYYKAPVYAVISGEIVRAGEPSFNTVAIYDKTNNITVVYLHLDSVANGIYEGKKVDTSTLIGYQGYKGAPNQTPEGSHVHIEIRPGLKKNAATSKDTHKDNPDPYPYWNRLL